MLGHYELVQCSEFGISSISWFGVVELCVI